MTHLTIELIIGLIVTITKIVMIVVISTLAHEFGHYIVAKIHGTHPKFGWDGINPAVIHDPIKDKWKGISVHLAGVFAGILSIILLGRYIGDNYILFLLLLGMIVASNYDINNVIYRIEHDDTRQEEKI